MVDGYHEKAEDNRWFKDKAANLEDRSRRNNIKIRGILETVLQLELLTYVQDFLKLLLPKDDPATFLVDRIHRIIKPKHLPKEVLMDVLLRVHFFHVKEKIMSAARKMSIFPNLMSNSCFFAEYSLLLSRKGGNFLWLEKF